MKWRAVGPLKEILIVLYLISGYGAIADRIASLGHSLSLLLYVGLFAYLSLCVILAAYVRNHAVRLTYALILFVSGVFLNSYESIASGPLTYDAFINMVNSSGFAGEAFDQHHRSIIWAVLTGLLLLAGIAIRPSRKPPLPPVASLLAPIAGVASLSAILFARGGDGASGLPQPMSPLAYLSLSTYEWFTGTTGPRKDVSIRRAAGKVSRDIVLIVDESVGANYLDLAASAGIGTGLAQPRPGIAIYNYGYAASITNCSVGTNLTLRFGGTRSDYKRINATRPSIWAYAREAGLRTVYIDGQRAGGRLHNLMFQEELREIDRFIQFDGVPVQQRDMAAADKLAELLNDGTADFIMVNKVGAHFPVHDKYPNAFMRYRPVLPRGGWEDVSDTGSRDGFSGKPHDWALYRNSYRNTLLWNVGEFFNRLLRRADLSRATLIYTSDHGQDLRERGNGGLMTHCKSDPEIEEGLVPLVVIEGDGSKTLDWKQNYDSNRNRASHYNIFPTLLELMGYDRRAVRTLYGESLATRVNEPLTFNARFNANLGLKPVWRHIEVGKIAEPPASMPTPPAAQDSQGPATAH